MMKIKSKEMFLDAIQTDRAWRRKELTNIQIIIYKSRSAYTKTLIKLGILLLYSHWEGYIKKVCEAFFCYLNFKSIKYIDLQPNFKAIGILSEMTEILSHGKFVHHQKAMDFINENFEMKKFEYDIKSVISLQSNLNTEFLLCILQMIGLDKTHFMNNKYFIDNKLLKFRNAFAHGENIQDNPEYIIYVDDFNDLCKRVNNLMDLFENQVINHIETESYKNS